MGCDIHLSVERRTGDRWENVDKWEDSDGYISNYSDSYYSGRNYDLFAILANVRNGSGFAGCDTGDGFVPIAEPRGVPEDASPEYRKWVEQWDGDGHSHSFFTVAELMAYDWTQTTKHRGWVGLSDWARWKLSGKPRDWCGSVGGRGVMHFSPGEVDRAFQSLGNGDIYALLRGEKDAIKHLALTLGASEYEPGIVHSVYTQVEWSEPCYASVSNFLGTTLPRLWRLGKPEDVRIVFFFDN